MFYILPSVPGASAILNLFGQRLQITSETETVTEVLILQTWLKYVSVPENGWVGYYKKFEKVETYWWGQCQIIITSDSDDAIINNDSDSDPNRNTNTEEETTLNVSNLLHSKRNTVWNYILILILTFFYRANA